VAGQCVHGRTTACQRVQCICCEVVKVSCRVVYSSSQKLGNWLLLLLLLRPRCSETAAAAAGW
jgi:hypothetical protein